MLHGSHPDTRRMCEELAGERSEAREKWGRTLASDIPTTRPLGEGGGEPLIFLYVSVNQLFRKALSGDTLKKIKFRSLMFHNYRFRKNLIQRDWVTREIGTYLTFMGRSRPQIGSQPFFRCLNSKKRKINSARSCFSITGFQNFFHKGTESRDRLKLIWHAWVDLGLR